MGRVVVIGSGLAGLSTAIRLRSSGHQVIVFEQAAEPGGSLGRIRLGDFFFDAEPGLWLLPQSMADLFASAGLRLDDYLDFLPVEPACRFLFPDGERFDLFTHEEKLRAEVKRLSPEDARGIAGFLRTPRLAFKAQQRAWQHPVRRWQDSLLGFLHPAALFRLPWLLDPHSASGFARSGWRHPHLRRAFAWAPLDLGSSPDHAPAAALWPLAATLLFGAWYPRGGTHGLRRALLRLIEHVGVELRCGEAVAEIVVISGRARGVITAGGHSVEAHAVVHAADPISQARLRYTPEPNKPDSFPRRWEKREPSFGLYAFLWGCGRDWPALAHRTVVFSDHPDQEFQPLREWRVPATDPTVTVVHPARTDPELTPRGRSALAAWFAAPALSARWRWNDDHRAAYRETLLGRLEVRGLEGLSTAIGEEKLLTPEDWLRFHGCARGSVWGSASHSLPALISRLPNRHPRVPRLYYCGRWTHPGPTSPQVVLASKLVAQLVDQDVGSE